MRRTGIRRNTVPAVCVLACVMAASAATPPMPNFSARRDYTGLDLNGVQVADTNGDGIPDIISNENGIFEVLLGTGNGTFLSGPSSNSGLTVAFSFVATDVNGDGKVDLVMAGENEHGGLTWGVAVSLGNGDGTFQPAVLYPAGADSYTYFLAVADFNGDGIPDIVTAGTQGVWLFTGKGDGTFNPGVLAVPLSTESGRLATADFNGDGNLDLVVTLPLDGPKGSGFAVVLGNGDGTFQTPQMFAQPKKPEALVVGVLTKGGYPGIVLGYSSPDVALYLGDGAGGFSGPHSINLPGAGYGIVIGDVNGDGIPDLVSAGVYIALGTKSGKFKSPIYYPIENAGGGHNMVLADLRNDGLTDIVVDSGMAISVLLSQGKGKYEDGVWTAVEGEGGCGAPADYNGDGKPDLAVGTSTGVAILLGTGNAKSPFSPFTTIPIAGTACVITGDLNGDGIPDLLVAVNGSPNALLSYLGNGDGTFTYKSTTPTPNSGGFVILADFNHDGKLDFATSGNLLALGNGDGTFQTPVPIVSNSPGFSGIAAGDINNDGWPDLVLTNGSSLTVNLYVLLNNQQGGFNQVPTNFGALTSQPILADLKGTGNLDLILGSPIGSGAVIYLGNGTGEFKPGPALQGLLGTVGTN